MNPHLIASAIVASFEAQLASHPGHTEWFERTAVLAAVRSLVTQAARNVATSIAIDAEEAAESARRTPTKRPFVAPNPPPIYDDIYEEGVHALNSNGGSGK